MTLRLVRALIAAALVSRAAVSSAPPAGAQSLDATRREAEALEARIREQGRRLSVAGEDFNEARVEREALEAQAAAARTAVVAAEREWSELRRRLGERARLLYMHPTAALEAFFGARSMSEVARARVYGGEVLLTDAELMNEAERARRQQR